MYAIYNIVMLSVLSIISPGIFCVHDIYVIAVHPGREVPLVVLPLRFSNHKPLGWLKHFYRFLLLRPFNTY